MQTYCSTNHLDLPFPPLRVQLLFLSILDIRVVDARFNAAITHRLDALSNRFCILRQYEFNTRGALD